MSEVSALPPAAAYAVIDGDGLATAFYRPEVNGDIPADAIPITEETWRAWIADTARQRWDAEAGALVAYVPPPQPVTVPAAVTARQARLALHAAGLLAQVEAAVAGAGGATQIEWEYATIIERASPLLAAIAGPGGLDLTAEQVDALFLQAATL